MRDATRDPQATATDLATEPTCCPGGACSPLFERPLLELAVSRILGFVRSRSTDTVAGATPVDPPNAQLRPTAAVVAAPPNSPAEGCAP